jgi:hypothetical protein
MDYAAALLAATYLSYAAALLDDLWWARCASFDDAACAIACLVCPLEVLALVVRVKSCLEAVVVDVHRLISVPGCEVACWALKYTHTHTLH